MERSTPVRVRHLLSHTSDEPPGTRYRYDGNAFGGLTQVVERATGEPFVKALTDSIPVQVTLEPVEGKTQWPQPTSDLSTSTSRRSRRTSSRVSKGTLRFPLSEPVPARMIERIAKFQAREVARRAKAKRTLRKKGI